MLPQNTLHVNVTLQKNITAKYFAINADLHSNFTSKNALYFTTLSNNATLDQIQQAIAKLQKASNTASVSALYNFAASKQLLKNSAAN
jgi:hypothetical protein